MAYIIKFSDPSVSSGKLSFPIPEYKSDGPAAPLSTALQGGQFGSSTAHTSLLLVGKGVPEYGEIIQENLVHMLENFASSGTAPVYPTIGQLWYNNSNKTLHVYTGATTPWEGLLKLTGGTMTGNLILNGNPVTNKQAATKAYVDNKAAEYLPLVGGTLSGSLFLHADPTQDTQASTKRYVDVEIVDKVSTHASDFDLHLTAAENLWMDAITATSDEVNLLSGCSSNVQTQIDDKISRGGDQMDGMLLLPALTPTDPLHAVTRSYVDNKVALYVPLAGGVVMTGTFQIPGGTPPGPNYVATKAYVDSVVGTGGGTEDGVVVSGTLDPVTGILTLSRSIGGEVYITNVAAFNHTHTTGVVSHAVVNSGTLLDLTYGQGSTILLNNIIDLFDSEKADVTYVDSSISASAAITESNANTYTDDMTTVSRSLVTSTGQTVFTTPTYVVGSHKLWVFVNGIKAYLGDSYTETTTTSVTFTYTVPSGAKVEFLVFGV